VLPADLVAPDSDCQAVATKPSDTDYKPIYSNCGAGLTNGGFETGSFSGWTAPGNNQTVISTSRKYSGSYGAQFAANDSISQSITTYPIQYRITLMCFVASSAITIQWNGVTVATCSVPGSTLTWTPVNVTVTGGATGSTLKIIAPNANNRAIDDVAVTPVTP